jgi:hypothetical protein
MGRYFAGCLKNDHPQVGHECRISRTEHRENPDSIKAHAFVPNRTTKDVQAHECLRTAILPPGSLLPAVGTYRTSRRSQS